MECLTAARGTLTTKITKEGQDCETESSQTSPIVSRLPRKDGGFGHTDKVGERCDEGVLEREEGKNKAEEGD